MHDLVEWFVEKLSIGSPFSLTPAFNLFSVISKVSLERCIDPFLRQDGG